MFSVHFELFLFAGLGPSDLRCGFMGCRALVDFFLLTVLTEAFRLTELAGEMGVAVAPGRANRYIFLLDFRWTDVRLRGRATVLFTSVGGSLGVSLKEVRVALTSLKELPILKALLASWMNSSTLCLTPVSAASSRTPLPGRLVSLSLSSAPEGIDSWAWSTLVLDELSLLCVGVESVSLSPSSGKGDGEDVLPS